jgi:hypothetical protein
VQIALATGARIVKEGPMPCRKKTLWTCLGIVAALLVVRLATSPVVFRVPFFYGEHSEEPRFVLLNPFRSRAPEKAANQALLSIMSGHCKETLASASDMEPERKRGICSLFAKYPLEYWDLRNRTDSADGCRLIYWHDGYPVVDVYVSKAEGRWKFTWINYVT